MTNDFEFDVEQYRKNCEMGWHHAMDTQVNNHVQFIVSRMKSGASVPEVVEELAQCYGKGMEMAGEMVGDMPHTAIQAMMAGYAFAIAQLAIYRTSFGNN